MAKVQSYVQFAAEHGLVTDYDVQGHIHGGLMAAHMPKSYHRRYQKKLLELQQARSDGLAQYNAALEAGVVVQPPEMTRIERLVSAASGDPDKPSTQAAKRILARYQERGATTLSNSGTRWP